MKNVDNTFTKVARHERVRFVGNVSVGSDVRVSELRKVVFSLYASHIWICLLTVLLFLDRTV